MSRSRLTTGFSLKSDFPTTGPGGEPASHLSEKVSKKQDTGIDTKQKYEHVMKHILKKA